MKRSTTLRNAIIVGVFTAICVIGMEFLALNIGQPMPFSQNYTVNAIFSDADGIPSAADVRVSGVDVGKVLSISHDPNYPGETVVTMQITDSTAVPVYSDGYAKVRPKTLLGEKYIDLTVGNPAASEAITSGGFLPVGQAGKDVSNDEIFNAFDQTTRQQQSQVLAALNTATLQRAGDIANILPQLEQVVSNLQPVANLYEKDNPQVDHIFVQLNTIMATLADEHQQLAGVLNNGNSVLGAVAAKDQALTDTLNYASQFANDINGPLNATIAAQRQAIQQLSPVFDSQNNLLNLVVGPQSSCGGRPCGIDEVFTGTLLGNINYPNDQLTVSSGVGELVTDEWASMFSAPAGNAALNLVLSFHCDAITTTLNNSGVPQSYIQALQALLKQLNITC